MQYQLRVDTAELQAMAVRWGAAVGQLNEAATPTGPGLSCQASAVAVTAAQAHVTAFAVALAGRVGTRAANVAEADIRYLANEADTVDRMTAVGRSVTSV